MKSATRYILPAFVGVALLALILGAITYSTGDTSMLIFKPAMSNEEYNALLIERLKSNLKSDRLKPEDRALLEGKLQDAELLATRDATYSNVDPATAWPIKQTVIAQATASPKQSSRIGIQATGIIDDRPSSEFSRKDRFSSYWVQDFENTRLFIFVGHEKDNPEQGIIAIVIGVPRVHPDIRFKVPGNTGKLKLESADGDWLYISAESGAEFKFNKFTYQLIDAGTGEEIPIVIPEGGVKEGYP